MSNCIASELLKNGKTVLYQTAPVLLESVIDYKFSKTLEYCGTNMCVSFSDKLENDKRILEAILEATNRRLELEVKKNKEQLGVKE